MSNPDGSRPPYTPPSRNKLDQRCKFCSRPTAALARMCDNCWEIHHRVQTIPLDRLRRIILDAQRDVDVQFYDLTPKFTDI